MYLSGVPIARISELLRHKDEKTKQLCIGIDIDLKTDAMNQVARWRAQQRAQMGLLRNRALPDEASIRIVQSGIMSHS